MEARGEDTSEAQLICDSCISSPTGEEAGFQASLEQDAMVPRDTSHLVFELISSVLVEAQGLRLASARLEQDRSPRLGSREQGGESLSCVVWKRNLKSLGLGALCVVPPPLL